jgi:hypothetical protein
LTDLVATALVEDRSASAEAVERQGPFGPMIFSIKPLIFILLVNRVQKAA